MTRSDPVAPPSATATYRTIWRWHFYAGLFVLPFVLILSLTGAIYLFKPQIEHWEERAWLGLGTRGAVAADAQLAAVLAANPGARFENYRLPRQAGDAAMIQLGLADGTKRQLFVSPQGKVLASLDPDARFATMVARIHGTLLLGRWGDRLVELAASWTIVMILTGLYLWWPRPFRAAGTLYPRLALRGRPLLRDIHRATGFWIAGLVLVMLASGLPWAGVWGSAFQWARVELGLVNGPQSWKIGAGGDHAGHHGAMPMPAMPARGQTGLPLASFVARAEAEQMAFPVLVLPPHAPQRFGPPVGDEWIVKSEAQNRWLGRRVTYDPYSGAETGRSGFADQHVVDRVVATGVAWHEGQLFGIANQIVGVLTAIALIAISVLGVVMWLKRRPEGSFGAPMRLGGATPRGAVVALVILALLLPLFGASLIVVLILDQLRQRFGGRPGSTPATH